MNWIKDHPKVVDFITLACVVGVVLMCSWPGMGAPLFSDDVFQVDLAKGYSHWTEVFKPDVFGFYRPVKNLLFLLLLPFSENLLVWHGVGLSAYLLAMLGVFRIAEICLESRRLALLAAAVWALSPTCVSTAVWLSCANISLGLACAAGVFHFHELAQIHSRPRWLIAALPCYLLSLLCYETFIVVPALLFLRDLQKQRLVPWLSGGLRYGLYLAAALVFLWVRQEFSAKGPGGTYFHAGFAPDTTLWRVALSSPWFFWRHFLMWVMPAGNIEILGSYAWMRSVSMPGLVASWVFLGAWLTVAAWLWRRQQVIAFGLLFFFVASVPSGNFLPCFNGPINDAYVTIPSVGLALVFAQVSRWLWRLWRQHRVLGEGRRLILVVLVVVIIYRIPASAAYFRYWAGVWQNPTSMLLLMTESRPVQFQIKGVTAKRLFSDGYVEAAELLARETLQEAPWNQFAKFTLARVSVWKGDLGSAEGYLRSILEPSGTIRVDFFVINGARFELAELLVRFPDRLEEAAALCRLILESGSKERAVPAVSLLTRIYATQGHQDKARATLVRGLGYYPNDPKLMELLMDVDSGKSILLDTDPESGHQEPPKP